MSKKNIFALHRSRESALRPQITFFVRHAESTGNRQACLQGSRIGGALSERGHQQSVATAEYLFETFEELRHGNVHLVSSPSNRAMESAAPIALRLNCAVHIEDGLTELDFGDWSGEVVSRLESNARYVQWKADPWINSPPDGESLVEVRRRVWRTVSRLVKDAAAAGRPLIFVTHFFPLMTLFETLESNRQVRCDNASVSRFELWDGEWIATHVNETRHLRQVAPAPVRYV